MHGVIRTSPELYEPKGKDGVHLIVDDLLPWGTATYDRKGYQTQLDAIAATARLGTSFTLKVQSKDFERGMELLADGLLHPAFAPAASRSCRRTRSRPSRSRTSCRRPKPTSRSGSRCTRRAIRAAAT